ncbi:MAG: hypothetical protein ACT4OX_03150 [Actinomycetota bacterium]
MDAVSPIKPPSGAPTIIEDVLANAPLVVRARVARRSDSACIPLTDVEVLETRGPDDLGALISGSEMTVIRYPGFTAPYEEGEAGIWALGHDDDAGFFLPYVGAPTAPRAYARLSAGLPLEDPYPSEEELRARFELADVVAFAEMTPLTETTARVDVAYAAKGSLEPGAVLERRYDSDLPGGPWTFTGHVHNYPPVTLGLVFLVGPDANGRYGVTNAEAPNSTDGALDQYLELADEWYRISGYSV